jgi:RNA polymerase sigma factor (sigma-70 family)
VALITEYSSDFEKDPNKWNAFFRELTNDVTRILKSKKKFQDTKYGIEDAVYEAINRFLDPRVKLNCKNPKSWIIRVAGNILISEHRKNETHNKYVQNQKRDEQVYHPWENPPLQELPTQEFLDTCIAQLSNRRREVIIAHFAGTTDEQIAEKLGIDESTVRVHKSTAINLITKCLRDVTNSRNSQEKK